MVAVINCVLNHNARAQGAAQYAGMNHHVVDLLREYDAGVIQMPCPEMTCLGLMRERDAEVSILDILDTPKGRSCCKRLSLSVADDIEEFLSHGYTVAAVLGGDVGSPGCALYITMAEDGRQVLGDRSGVFMKALHRELRDRNIEIPFRGIRDSSAETLREDLAWIEETLAGL